MSIQRIDNPRKFTHGWQARWPGPLRRMTAFFSDGRYGGASVARLHAEAAEAKMRKERK